MINPNNKNNVSGNKSIRLALSFALVLFTALSAVAQEKAPAKMEPSVYSNPLLIALLCTATMLLLVIMVFGKMLKAAAAYKNEQSRNKGTTSTGPLKTILLLLFLGTVSGQLYAAPVAAHAQGDYWGLDSFTFYSLITLIAVELFVAWLLYDLSMELMGVKERKLQEAKEKERAKALSYQPTFLEKMNASVAIEKESDIMFGHEYDGIRELDNNLPPWWVYGFFVTIVFAFVYLVHYQVLHTGQSPEEEYLEQVATGKAEADEFRKKAANLVDENNVTLLTDKASLASGSAIYMEHCVACHGKSGEGSVGPNLTDDYWIHKGGIKDIFISIKYGWPEKGMKSWQQDLGAKQIHELSSFIKSLKGSNPANAKEAQGELYAEESVKDSTLKAVPDSALAPEKK